MCFFIAHMQNNGKFFYFIPVTRRQGRKDSSFLGEVIRILFCEKEIL